MCWTACYRKKHWEHLWSPRHSTAPISISVRNVLASVMHTRFLSIVFLICDYCCWQWEVECSSLSLYACPGLKHIAVCMTSLHAPWCWACLLAVNRLLFTGWRSLWFFCPQPHCPWSARSMFPVLQWLVCKCEQHTSIVNSFLLVWFSRDVQRDIVTSLASPPVVGYHLSRIWPRHLNTGSSTHIRELEPWEQNPFPCVVAVDQGSTRQVGVLLYGISALKGTSLLWHYWLDDSKAIEPLKTSNIYPQGIFCCNKHRKTSASAMAEGPRNALVSRNSATTKYPYRMALFAWSYV